MTDFRTDAQRRIGAIHHLDVRGLTADEAGEAMENIDQLLADSAKGRGSENERQINEETVGS